MPRGNRTSLKTAKILAPAHWVFTAMLVVTFLIGLLPGSHLAPTLGPMAARADQSSTSPTFLQSGHPLRAETVVYCPMVLHNWLPNPPVIASFVASPDTINPGESTTLNWSIDSPVDEVTLEPGAGVVTVLSSYAFSPAETTTYTLTAFNGFGSSSAHVTVVVRRPPQIASFTVTPETVELGQSTTLAWSVAGPVSMLQIEPGVGDVTGQTSIQVTPTGTTTYTLIASGVAGSSTAQATVDIEPPPEITSFLANPDAIEHGESAELSWEISNAVRTLTLEPGIGDVTGQTSAVVSPTQTTVYTLTVSSGSGTDRAQVTVNVDTSQLAHELLVYDWNQPVTTAQRGFPRRRPLDGANGDWTTPINFADGTLYFRVEIHNQPVSQEMKPQFCFWQYDKTLENCGRKELLTGNPGTVVTWQTRVQSMYKKDGLSIDWKNPREICGVAIKNAEGEPVSDIHQWDWSGEDPDEWYPLDWRFTVVVVAEGARFSGWENYTD